MKTIFSTEASIFFSENRVNTEAFPQWFIEGRCMCRGSGGHYEYDRIRVLCSFYFNCIHTKTMNADFTRSTFSSCAYCGIMHSVWITHYYS